ncbi:FadR/GntR family transcriptional regulator [Fodinicurvata sediminis]|uniref:FadR/GntR family transcriptional regulator n=1 Tax=Fodinicurvata sediminis TaxID=1121832 RepID=UPI0003B71CBC|nr:FCD domain-containing protein [Fodinicurvata sediminis]
MTALDRTYQAPSQRPHKRSDVIVEQIKRWIVEEGKRPGDKLPHEKELIRIFSAGRGTVREALKSLEVQGLIINMPGADGGAVLSEVPYGRAMHLLRNYFHSRTVTFGQVYAVRKFVEPEVAAAAVGHLSKRDFEQLQASIETCQCSDRERHLQRKTQRAAELDFHDIIARACPNPLMAFIGRFLNDVLRDLVVLSAENFTRHGDFLSQNCRYHALVMDALRKEDAEAVRALMHEHMIDAESYMIELDAQIEGTWLGPPRMREEDASMLPSNT